MKSAYSAVPTYDYSPEKAGGRYNDIMPPKYIESLGGDDDDGGETSLTKLKRWFRKPSVLFCSGVFMFAVLTVGFNAAKLSMHHADSPIDSTVVSLNDDKSNDDTDIASDDANDEFRFSLKRSGYEGTVPYVRGKHAKTFTSSFARYAVLEDYDFMVEPYSHMTFHAVNPVIGNTYVFTVCEEAGTETETETEVAAETEKVALGNIAVVTGKTMNSQSKRKASGFNNNYNNKKNQKSKRGTQEKDSIQQCSSATTHVTAANENVRQYGSGSGSEDEYTTVTTALKIECRAYDLLTASIEQFDANNKLVNRIDGVRGMCMYVRREIRSLSADDLSAFIAATAVVYSTEQEKGEALYGGNFRNSSYLLRWHHFNAGQQDADHLHEGNGFLLQHAKVTNIFEKSLQAVNPSLALPYWDFTIDNALKYDAYHMSIMTDKIFGSMPVAHTIKDGFNYETDRIIDARIPDGVFKDTAAEKNVYDTAYGYGYMRGPWNMNPSK